MKVGTLAYATCQGLGYLARSFHQHGVVTDVLVVRHSSRPTQEDWYPGAPQTPIRPFNQTLARQFCADMDVMLFFETPFDWTLIDYCRSMGVKTVLMPMYECTPERLPAVPDLFLCPSELDYRVFGVRDNWTQESVKYLPVPVEVPWKLRTRAEVFVHHAGHGSFRDRNGTAELLQAMQYAESPIKLIVRSQNRLEDKPNDNRIRYIERTEEYEHLWDEGDVFVFPERFNGLSLPLQEARAAGMLVMGSDRFPMNTWLPRSPLIPVKGYQRARIGPSCMEFDEAQIDPKAIAATIDEWNGRDVTVYSQAGQAWAGSMSWANLLPRYRKVLEGLLPRYRKVLKGLL